MREEALELLKKLIEIPSPSGEELEVCEYICGWLEDVGFKPKRSRPMGGTAYNVTVTLGRGGGHLLVDGHVDTVPSWDMERPFEARVVGEYVYGRGAADMKGGVVSMMLAAERLLEHEDEFENRVTFAFVVDEEYMGRGTIDVLLTEDGFDAAVVCEPTGLKLGIAQAGCLDFVVETRGRTAHAACPEAGVNAITEMCRVLSELSELPLLKEAGSLEGMRPTINVGKVEGGFSSWVVPSECRAYVLINTIPTQKPERVKQELQRFLEKVRSMGVNCSVKYLDEDEGYELSPDEPIVRLMARHVERVLGKVGYTFVGSWTDANTLYFKGGVPSVIFGPGRIEHGHSSEERVSLSEVVKCAEILTSACREFGARGLEPERV